MESIIKSISFKTIVLYVLLTDFIGLVFEFFLHRPLHVPGADLFGFSNYDFLLAAIYSLIVFLIITFRRFKISEIARGEKARVIIAGFILIPIIMPVIWLPTLFVLVFLFAR